MSCQRAQFMVNVRATRSTSWFLSTSSRCPDVMTRNCSRFGSPSNIAADTRCSTSMSKPSIWPDSGLREPMSSVSAETPTISDPAGLDRLHGRGRWSRGRASGAYDVVASSHSTAGAAAAAVGDGRRGDLRFRRRRAGRSRTGPGPRRPERTRQAEQGAPHRYSSTRFEMPRQLSTAATRPATRISQPTRTAELPAPDSACVRRRRAGLQARRRRGRERVERGVRRVRVGADREGDRLVPLAGVVERADLGVLGGPRVERLRRARRRRRRAASRASAVSAWNVSSYACAGTALDQRERLHRLGVVGQRVRLRDRDRVRVRAGLDRPRRSSRSCPGRTRPRPRRRARGSWPRTARS